MCQKLSQSPIGAERPEFALIKAERSPVLSEGVAERWIFRMDGFVGDFI